MSGKNKGQSNKVAELLFFFSLLFIGFSYGFMSYRNDWFPASLISEAYKGFKAIIQSPYDDPMAYAKINTQTKIQKYLPKLMKPGLTAITSMESNADMGVKVINGNGVVIHQWMLDWFTIWPDATHIDPISIPHSKPGTGIHGTAITANGDLIFNFEYIGLVRMNACGEVLWRLPKLTHHALYIDENDHIWVPSRIYHDKPSPFFQNYPLTFYEDVILEVSPEGIVLQEISMLDLLIDNGYQGLLLMFANDQAKVVNKDSVHLNDVETFPSTMIEGIFSAGDVLVSLRDISTVIVFDQKNRKIKYISIGKVTRQHDPDFVDGKHISIFDNKKIDFQKNPTQDLHSRIIILSAANGSISEHYVGTDQNPFYSEIRGKHQWLDNGNMLITESGAGRAFEITADGKIVWDYINIIEKGYAGVIFQADRLPTGYSESFFEQAVIQCRSN
jgi:hypothetical protein